jgi:mRNA-degrading endonuclease RelE of RelBE toxin-antitoxin system
MLFSIAILPSALSDIQKAIDYYDEHQLGVSEKFESEVNQLFLALHKNPFYQLRYKTVHCLPLKKFPFMIHFTVDEKTSTIYVRAILHTSLNPDDYWLK